MKKGVCAKFCTHALSFNFKLSSVEIFVYVFPNFAVIVAAH